MRTIAIIGAGQLGSRHLQGVHKSVSQLDIWVADSNPESLDVARQRYEQVEATAEHHVHYVNSIDRLPERIDMAIIATSSMPRMAVVRQLLGSHSVDTLILEKFLFPEASQYDEASALINRSGVKAYVNCPRRMYTSFEKVRGLLTPGTPLTMRVEGSEWGLCCNAIHYIDIFMSLCGATDFEADTSGLIGEVLPSKRAGYIEINGTLRITTPAGDSLTLVCEADGRQMLMKINDMELDEVHGTLSVGDQTYSVPTPFQSQLSDRLVDEPITLVDYETSKKFHLTFLAAMLDFVNGLTGRQDTLLPIT